MIKLVIFDLDGTLVDSAEDIMNAANEMLVARGLQAVGFKTMRTHIGEGFNPFLKHVAGDKQNDLGVLNEVFEHFQKIYDKQLTKFTKFYEGVEKFIQEFQSYPGTKIGIVTNKPEYQARIILDNLGIKKDHLVEIFGGDRFEVKKPHAKPLIEMMALAGAGPNETVMIGDSRADVDAAKNAGTHFIAVSFGYNSIDRLKEFGANRFIHHFDELLPTLKTLAF